MKKQLRLRIVYAAIGTTLFLVSNIVTFEVANLRKAITRADGSGLDVRSNPDGTGTIALTKEQMDECDVNHGCSLWPNDKLGEAADKLVQDQCGSDDPDDPHAGNSKT